MQCRPLTSYFYIAKLGFTGGKLYLLIFALKHRLCVLVRTNEAVPTCTHNLLFGKNKKDIKIVQLKFVIFTAVKIAVFCIGVFSICFRTDAIEYIANWDGHLAGANVLEIILPILDPPSK